MQPSTSLRGQDNGLELHKYSKRYAKNSMIEDVAEAHDDLVGSMAIGSDTTLSTEQNHGGARPGTDGTVSDKPLNPDESSNMYPIDHTSTEPMIHYPKGASLWTIFAGLFFAVLCVGLVRLTSHILSPPTNPLTTKLPGPIHRRNSYPKNHERLQLPRRHRLVRLSISPHDLLLPAALRETLRRVFDQVGVSRRAGGF